MNSIYDELISNFDLSSPSDTSATATKINAGKRTGRSGNSQPHRMRGRNNSRSSKDILTRTDIGSINDMSKVIDAAYTITPLHLDSFEYKPPNRNNFYSSPYSSQEDYSYDQHLREWKNNAHSAGVPALSYARDGLNINEVSDNQIFQDEAEIASTSTGKKKRRKPKHAASAAGRSTKSITVERAMQRRQKRLADLERRSGASYADLHDNANRSRARTRVRYSTALPKVSLAAKLGLTVNNMRQKVPFLSIMAGMVISGLMGILWLTSQSALNVYNQEKLANRNTILNNYVNQMTKELAEDNSAPVIAQKAARFGMVPATNINVLRHEGDQWRVIGNEKGVQKAAHIPSYVPPRMRKRKHAPPRPSGIFNFFPPAHSDENPVVPEQDLPGGAVPSPMGYPPNILAPYATHPAGGISPELIDEKPEMPVMSNDPAIFGRIGANNTISPTYNIHARPHNHVPVHAHGSVREFPSSASHRTRNIRVRGNPVQQKMPPARHWVAPRPHPKLE